MELMIEVQSTDIPVVVVKSKLELNKSEKKGGKKRKQ